MSPATDPAADRQVIHIHPAAPVKPAFGTPCNGCGVCCLSAPCPVGMLVSRRRSGACSALVWEADDSLYRCGMVRDPLSQLGWRDAPRGWSAWLGRRMRRWIAAGEGCDADVSVERPG
ncbi:hypothetical protein RD110_06730 [Rhodoferax koreense]|uniref:4Fe-4S ferredoxin-type domain-containing protein n=1 Tax=Rhodoferax koreensis TaxID=1842727 RepID=A0A1P8JT73_9BURK|nr:hypothetical protein [Rhodoferax koreense]APW36925.1 hypothetical protein RD110_06730 [Rhodoferax koreense]